MSRWRSQSHEAFAYLLRTVLSPLLHKVWPTYPSGTHILDNKVSAGPPKVRLVQIRIKARGWFKTLIMTSTGVHFFSTLSHLIGGISFQINALSFLACALGQYIPSSTVFTMRSLFHQSAILHCSFTIIIPSVSSFPFPFPSP